MLKLYSTDVQISFELWCYLNEPVHRFFSEPTTCIHFDQYDLIVFRRMRSRVYFLLSKRNKLFKTHLHHISDNQVIIFFQVFLDVFDGG